MQYWKFYIKILKYNLKEKSKKYNMDIIKFETEVKTLKDFFECFCENKHENQKSNNIKLFYKETEVEVDLHLCTDCLEKINYSFDRLLGCPHEIKPRCRSCPNPCYGKQEWKDTAKIMKYSGMKLGLSKLNKKIKNLFKSK